MILLLSTFGVCLISAVFPVVSAEAYLGTLAAVGEGSRLWPVAASAAFGQTCGKVMLFQVGRSSMNWRWLRRKIDSPKWQERITRWQKRTQGNPWSVTALISASAVIGLPPLAIISVIAGQLGASLTLFVPAVFIGRTLRFAAVLGGVAAFVV